MTLDVTEATQGKLAELRKVFGLFTSDEAMAAYVIDRYHAAFLGVEMPDGWQFEDDITLADLEAYFSIYDDMPAKSNAWAERGRVIRSALRAGWIKQPDKLTDADIDKLLPSVAAQLKNALDAHYLKVTLQDPNS